MSSSFIDLVPKSVALVLAATLLVVGSAKDTVTAPVLPGAFIVEFADVATGNTAEFYKNLTNSKISATPRLELAHELFNGASFHLETNQDINATVDTITSMAMISNVWPIRLYSRPAILKSTLDTFSTESKSLHKRAVADTYSPHVMGGVDKLHAEGFTGEGIFIGIIDTGVDYNHPALGGGFGPGHKFIAGTDLVGDVYDGTKIPVPDPDPIDCEGHGTHVSGIIGADLNPFNFTGVAPNATLGMWKVFGCNGNTGNDVLIAAFNMAYEAGVDLISSSIGGSSGWVEDPWDVAVQRITEKGVPCIIAAGNDGATGLFFTSNAGEGIGALSVGSVDNTDSPALLTGASYLVNGIESSFWYSQGHFGDFGTITAPLYAITLDSAVTGDACTALPASTPDLSPYVVLIRRGVCAFDTKITNALAFGARRFMFYNNVPGPPASPGDTNNVIPVGMVSDIQGSTWISELKAGSIVTIELLPLSKSPNQFTNDPNTLTGGKMSTFSSWGPTYEAWIKPEVSAPGGSILSTYPLNKGGYAVESGTSMATPYVAGIIALLKQVRGKKAFSPDNLTSLLATTGKPMDFNDGKSTHSFLAPAIQQGGGLVDAFTAAHTTTLLDHANIALNDTEHFQRVHQVIITNTGNSIQTYKFSNRVAATAYTLSRGIVPDTFPPSLATDTASGAEIKFVPQTLTVHPKSKGIVMLQFSPPRGLDAKRIPVYSGFVAINGSSGDILSLPYAGVASKLKDATVIDFEGGYPYIAASNATGTPVGNNTVFTIPETPSNSTAFPTVVYELAMGSRIIHINVVSEKAYELPGTAKNLGSIPGYPLENQPRNNLNTAKWDGSLVNGRKVLAGKYHFVIRALKILGNVDNNADYEQYRTASFEIKYSK